MKTATKKDKELTSPIIKNNKDYEKIMARIDELVKIPDTMMTKMQSTELNALALVAQSYEKSIYNIKPPSTFYGILEMKMYEMKLNQGEMAKMLQISNAKFSMILNGKQKPDIPLLKAVKERLGVDGNYLLSVL